MQWALRATRFAVAPDFAKDADIDSDGDNEVSCAFSPAAPHGAAGALSLAGAVAALLVARRRRQR